MGLGSDSYDTGITLGLGDGDRSRSDWRKKDGRGEVGRPSRDLGARSCVGEEPYVVSPKEEYEEE